MTLHLTDFARPPAATLPEVAGLFSQPVPPLPAMELAVFTETPELAALVETLGRSRQFGRVRLSQTGGGLQAALSAFANAQAPHVLLIETSLAQDALLEGLDALSELCDPDTRLLLVGGENDIALYRALIGRGVSDYLPRPVAAAHILQSLSDVASGSGAAAKGQVTAFIGASGGAGSSTVALNTAWLMGRGAEGHGPTGLIDLDLDFGTAGLSLALDGARGIAEAFRAGQNLDGQLLDGLFDTYDAHLRVLVATEAAGLSDAPAPEALDHLTDLARSGGQRVVLDLPAIGHPATRRALLAADRVVLTATPDLAGLKNCRKLLDLIATLRPDDGMPLVVLNKVGQSKRTEISAKDFAQTLGIGLAAVVHFDAKGFSHSANLGRVHVATRAGRSAASALQPLVRALAGPAARATAVKPAQKPLLQRLFRRA